MFLHSFFPTFLLRIPSGATLTLPFRVRPTQEELHGMKAPRWLWELAVKLIRKWWLLFDSVFGLMIRCVFNRYFDYGKDLPFYHILPHSHQKDLPVYPFWGSKPHWPSALMVWIRLQASLQNLRHSGFHANMCGNGCFKYMNRIPMLLLKYDIEKDGEYIWSRTLRLWIFLRQMKDNKRDDVRLLVPRPVEFSTSLHRLLVLPPKEEAPEVPHTEAWMSCQHLACIWKKRNSTLMSLTLSFSSCQIHFQVACTTPHHATTCFCGIFLKLRIEQSFVDWLREKERKGKRKKPEGKEKGKARPWQKRQQRARKPEVEKSKNLQVPQFLISSWHEVNIVENRIRELRQCCNPQGGAVESFSFFMCRFSTLISRKHCQFSFPRVSRHGTMARRSNPRHWAGALSSLVEADQTRFSWQKFGLL